MATKGVFKTKAEAGTTVAREARSFGNRCRAPTHSIAAALAAQPRRRLLQVDIRLPSFDVRQGPNVYDDVQSVEFCCQLMEPIMSSIFFSV